MSSTRAIFSGINGAVAADTGAGGLLDSSKGSAYLFGGIFRWGDPERKESANWPRLDVEAISNERDGFVADRVEALVRCHLFIDRDTSFTRLDAASAQLRSVLHDTKITDTSAVWTFSTMTQVREFEGPSSGHESHRIQEYRVNGNK